MLHCIRLCIIITHTGDVRYNLAHSKGTNRWILKKIMEDKDYSHFDTQPDDVITLQQIPSRLHIQNFEQPDSIPKNIAKSERPPKQEVIDAHITQFYRHSQSS